MCKMVQLSGILTLLLIFGGFGQLCFAVVFPSTATDWYSEGEESLAEALKNVPNTGVAKNVLLMIGDGMGISTVTASRIYGGQRQGKSGEENKLAFETLPYTALSKTYCDNCQITDSASSATAMLAGVKTKFAVLGLNAKAEIKKCATAAGNEVSSILHLAQKAGKSTGFVTTTSLTHATVAATYAHSASRLWESNGDIPAEEFNAGGCRDIAYQLVIDNPDINVMMAGGRKQFLPNTTADPQFPDKKGERTDGRNLIQEWQNIQTGKGRKHKYVWNRSQLSDVDPSTTDYLLGGFAPSYLTYMVDREADSPEPTLMEMTEKAIQILSKNPKGYFLLVEGGKIDSGHHDTSAKRAFEETLEFSRAVQLAKDTTDQKDTLLIVTADHSHTLTIGGWSVRGNDILGLVENVNLPVVAAIGTPTDGMPFTTLGYYNGIGSGSRVNLTGVDTDSKSFKQPVHVPLATETHAGEDVAVYSRGPLAHLLSSTRENNYIFHVMAYASCVGPNKAHCNQQSATTTTTTQPQRECNAAAKLVWNTFTIVVTICVTLWL